MVYKGGQYRSFTEKDNGDVSTVYIIFNEGVYRSDKLQIQSSFPFSLFINGKLADFKKSAVRMNIDSLRRVFHDDELAMAIHQEKIHRNSLATCIMSKQPAADTIRADLKVEVKPSVYFRDFAIIACLVLLGALVLIVRLNPKLAGDYFAVGRIFSLRESDDSQLNSRITSSSNILFYTYCSFIVSFYLMVIFHFVPTNFKSAWPFQATTVAHAFLQWLKLSLLLLFIFFSKIILIYTFTRLFSLQEIFGLHVFNWIRLMLLFFGTLSLFLICYYILHGQSEEVYTKFMWAVAGVLGLWVIIVFPKVMHNASFSLFHIFSYICATEIIPLLISIKIIYY